MPFAFCLTDTSCIHYSSGKRTSKICVVVSRHSLEQICPHYLVISRIGFLFFLIVCINTVYIFSFFCNVFFVNQLSIALNFNAFCKLRLHLPHSAFHIAPSRKRDAPLFACHFHDGHSRPNSSCIRASPTASDAPISIGPDGQRVARHREARAHGRLSHVLRLALLRFSSLLF